MRLPGIPFSIELIETSLFTKQVVATLSEEEYRAFQLYLIGRPDAGVVIPGSGGLRKLRWRLPGRGKRGGARVIYYWKSAVGQIFLLFLYPKNVRSDLSAPELRVLRALVAGD
jgi:hypothetical protein